MSYSRLSVVPAGFSSTQQPEHVILRKSFGQILVDDGALQPGDLAEAKALVLRQDCRLEDILLHKFRVDEAALYGAMSRQYGAAIANLAAEPPDARLIDHIGVQHCITSGVCPWRLVGGATVIATSRPDEFAQLKTGLPQGFGPVLMAIAPLCDIHAALMKSRLRPLARAAETRVNDAESCRAWDSARATRLAIAAMLFLIAVGIVTPLASFTILSIIAIFFLLLTLGLKLTASAVQFRSLLRRANRIETSFETSRIARLPTVSIIVPLLHEREIAANLIVRLKQLNYPRELLDILLVVESDDATTRRTLAQTHIPDWVRIIVVPEGKLRTKPRALNFALDFCRGSIIGVYDAEDAPHPDQIHTMVHRFHECAPEVACLQGVLDFYNTRRNWLSRCFTIEYATWFRIMLPGLQKMNLAIPLGGTTLFFRRAALEKLGGWDAHNVTEDADLGIRLARHGMRTEVIDTVTEEEANCSAVPWVKQRSRWLKGYAITWAVHMRNPMKLLRELGWWKFTGVQIIFLGTLSQFLLAPVLWSFWLIPLGIPHPLSGFVPAPVLRGLAILFISAEIATISIGILSVSGRKHRFLIPWVATLLVYFPLGALASYKAFYELLTRPFYWDKTTHGQFSSDHLPPNDQPDPALPRGTQEHPAHKMAPEARHNHASDTAMES